MWIKQRRGELPGVKLFDSLLKAALPHWFASSSSAARLSSFSHSARRTSTESNFGIHSSRKMASELVDKMPYHHDAIGKILSTRQAQHTCKEIAILAVATMLILAVLWTHKPKFEPSGILLAKCLLLLAFLWTFLIEASWT